MSEPYIDPFSKLPYSSDNTVSDPDWRELLKKEPKDIADDLRELYPHGHPSFIDLCIGEMELHSKKNYDYAHGGDPLGNFRRVSEIKKLYPGIDWSSPLGTCLDYMFKQQDAICWQLSQGYEGQVEGMDKKAEDCHVYWKLFRILLRILLEEA